MGVIKLLDEQVSQLIAAGEVVERPSSVVKELVENAIDAKASKVTIEIRHGGVTMIRVSDNGSGIAPEDVPMMFLRHATSKVRSREDLGCIATLGFRGEAMASIHAVSRIEVLTRQPDCNEGTRYVGEGSQTGQMEPAGCPVGTTVKVCDLFYNTPARMKFLKKDVQEGNAVAAVVERVALSHPEISFQFIREGQTRIHTPGDGKLLSAIHAVYGREFTRDLAAVDYTTGQIHVEGYIALPVASRSNRTMQTFFVNGRYVKSGTARAALEEAYKHSIMVGKFPACVLNLSIPFTETDINVHPAKIEVRFTNERPVFDAVYYAVKDALSREDYTPVPKQTKKPMTVFDLQRQPQVEQQQLTQTPAPSQPQRVSAQQYRQMVGLPQPTQRSVKTKSSAAHKAQPDDRITFRDHDPQTAKWEREHPLILLEEPKFTPTKKGKDSIPQEEKCETPVQTSAEKEEKRPEQKTPEQSFHTELKSSNSVEQEREMTEPPQLRLVGEVLGTYLVVESADSMILIDKHAAHERLIFNRLKQQCLTDDRQLLLEPVVVHLSREDYQGAAGNLALFEQAGFLVEEFGDGDLLVREVPVMLSGAQIREIVEQTAHDLSQHKKDMTPHALDDLLHSVACKSAVRANDKNTVPELWEIVQLLQEDENARYCPHGRPVARSFSRRELEKLFGRLG